jgi:Calcineurin-like phosphoesterase
VFDAINQMKAEAVSGSPEDFQFFTTVGDNIYPKNESEPSKEELEESMNLFLKREHIKDIPIYPIRGNHDCYFDD